MSAYQMIQLARVVGLEVSLATFGMLEDVLLKIGEKRRKGGGDRGSGQSPLFSRTGSTNLESVASRSFYSFPTITASADSSPSEDGPVRQHRYKRQADDAWVFPRRKSQPSLDVIA